MQHRFPFCNQEHNCVTKGMIAPSSVHLHHSTPVPPYRHNQSPLPPSAFKLKQAERGRLIVCSSRWRTPKGIYITGISTQTWAEKLFAPMTWTAQVYLSQNMASAGERVTYVYTFPYGHAPVLLRQNNCFVYKVVPVVRGHGIGGLVSSLSWLL